MTDYSVTAAGSWRTKDGERRLVVELSDPGNHSRLAELSLSEKAVLDILSTRRDSGANGVLSVYGFERAGMTMQVVTLALPLDEYGLPALHKAIRDSEMLQWAYPQGWQIEDIDHWNMHRYIDKTYRLKLSRFVERGIPVDADLRGHPGVTVYDSSE